MTTRNHPARTAQDAADADTTMWRPVGPVTDSECQSDADFDPCTIRPAWRITSVDVGATFRAFGGTEVGRALTVAHGAATWLVCTPHLGHAIALTDEVYGSPLLVEVWHG